ncbi:MAG: DUF6394 family protein [Gammaproteobacteria bacterium]|nr:DUF6394 family protein [Gammaproteobacteria bacterium]
MNLEKVAFGFFIVLALTLNVAFVVGDIDNPNHHNVWLLFAAIVVNIMATLLKLGDRSQIGALLLATGLVADLQLVVCASIWTIAVYGTEAGLSTVVMASIVSLATGALVANIVSVTMAVADTLMLRR